MKDEMQLAPQQAPPPSPAEARRPGLTAEDLMPLLDLATAIRRRNFMSEVARSLMKPDIDYGSIAGSKPTLLKPGAERLCTVFGLSVELHVVTAVEDWTGEGEGRGEPLFYYHYRVRLTRNGILIAEGDGSCNSRESKYRYRAGERRCPKCGKPAIIRGREDYGGGWLCFAKKGGCGAKFKAGDPAIEGQPAERVLNPDITDQVNTIQKMAYKRALVAAVLIATNASEFYSQDVEDMEVIDIPSAQPVRQARVEPEPRHEPKPGTGSAPDATIPPELEAIWAKMRDRASIGEALQGLLDDLSARIGGEAARGEFQGLLARYGADKWEALRSIKTARKFARDLYALVAQVPEPDRAPALFEQEMEEDPYAE
jgi:hypothetical protein